MMDTIILTTILGPLAIQVADGEALVWRELDKPGQWQTQGLATVQTWLDVNELANPAPSQVIG